MGDKLAEQMFQFSKKRIAEIEDYVVQVAKMQKLYEPAMPTKLESEGAAATEASKQKELLRGKYIINFDMALPYKVKI